MRVDGVGVISILSVVRGVEFYLFLLCRYIGGFDEMVDDELMKHIF